MTMVENRATAMRSPGLANLIDVLDRVLDKGIVIDAWVRVSLVGLDVIGVDGFFRVCDPPDPSGSQPPPAHSAAVGRWRPERMTAFGCGNHRA
jgi:hypothetical protein